MSKSIVQQYEVIGLDRDGNKKVKIFNAVDERKARSMAFKEGIFVEKVKLKKNSLLNKEYYSRAYIEAFIESLYFQTKHGRSAAMALKEFIENESNPNKRLNMQESLNILDSGGTFEDAIDKLPFLDLTSRTVIKSSSMAGKIQKGLKIAIMKLKHSKESWKKFSKKISFIAIDIFMVLPLPHIIVWGGVGEMLKKSLPLERVTAEQKIDILEKFQASMDFNLYTAWGINILFFLIFVFGLIYISGGKQGKEFIEGGLAKIPIFHRWLLYNASSTTLLLLSSYLRSGLNGSVAINLIKKDAPVVIKGYWNRVAKKLEEGADIREAIADPEILKPEEVYLIKSTINTEVLSEVLNEIADRHEQKSELAFDRVLDFLIYLTLALTIFVIYAGWTLFAVQQDAMDMVVSGQIGGI